MLILQEVHLNEYNYYVSTVCLERKMVIATFQEVSSGVQLLLNKQTSDTSAADVPSIVKMLVPLQLGSSPFSQILASH